MSFTTRRKIEFHHMGLSEELEEEEYGEDDNGSIILSQESTHLVEICVPEFEVEDGIHSITSQNDALESKDEAVDRRKPEQWADYSESEDVEFCISPQQSVSDVDDEPLEIDSPEPQKLSSLHESHLELDDHQDGEPLGADRPEP